MKYPGERVEVSFGTKDVCSVLNPAEWGPQIQGLDHFVSWAAFLSGCTSVCYMYVCVFTCACVCVCVCVLRAQFLFFFPRSLQLFLLRHEPQMQPYIFGPSHLASAAIKPHVSTVSDKVYTNMTS